MRPYTAAAETMGKKRWRRVPEWAKKRERVKRERAATFAMLDAAKAIAEAEPPLAENESEAKHEAAKLGRDCDGERSEKVGGDGKNTSAGVL